jgi:hypothetical protein
MARRISAKHRVPGNPLAGVLRQQAQQARAVSRRSAPAPGPQGEAGEAGPRGEPGAPGVGATAVVVLTSDAAGLVAWTFPERLATPPVVTAVPVAAEGAVLVAVAAVTEAAVTLRVLRQSATTHLFTAAPGVEVHVAVYA